MSSKHIRLQRPQIKLIVCLVNMNNTNLGKCHILEETDTAQWVCYDVPAWTLNKGGQVMQQGGWGGLSGCGQPRQCQGAFTYIHRTKRAMNWKWNWHTRSWNGWSGGLLEDKLSTLKWFILKSKLQHLWKEFSFAASSLFAVCLRFAASQLILQQLIFPRKTSSERDSQVRNGQTINPSELLINIQK